jgi:prephenate dehydrogenase
MNRALRVGILGDGRFGAALAGLLAEHHYPWRAWDAGRPVPEPHAATDAVDLLAGADIVVIAVPAGMFATVLRELRPHFTARHQVLDVCSVKQAPCGLMDEVLGADIRHVGCHPLFGPLSIARAEPLRTIICPSPRHPGAAAQARALFASIGSEIAEMTPAEHDRHMAMTHAMAFFLARGLLELGVGEDLHWTPPSFAALASSIAAVRADAGHLFNAIQRENPYAAATRKHLIEALTLIDQRVSVAPVDLGVLSVPEVHGGGADAGTVQDVLEHVDEVDRELLSLLQRRRELCARAASLPGAVAISPGSDAQAAEDLLARLGAPGDSGLPAEDVRAVFRHVLAFCRPPQGDTTAAQPTDR